MRRQGRQNRHKRHGLSAETKRGQSRQRKSRHKEGYLNPAGNYSVRKDCVVGTTEVPPFNGINWLAQGKGKISALQYKG
jgi:hypothetical protein